MDEDAFVIVAVDSEHRIRIVGDEVAMAFPSAELAGQEVPRVADAIAVFVAPVLPLE